MTRLLPAWQKPSPHSGLHLSLAGTFQWLCCGVPSPEAGQVSTRQQRSCNSVGVSLGQGGRGGLTIGTEESAVGVRPGGSFRLKQRNGEK